VVLKLHSEVLEGSQHLVLIDLRQKPKTAIANLLVWSGWQHRDQAHVFGVFENSE
jgi:hypothetical protein